MNIRSLATRYTPDFIKSMIRLIKTKYQRQRFKSLEVQDCITDNLISETNISLIEIFQSDQIDEKWKHSKEEISRFRIPDGTGGVNHGDRKALYYLISYFEPESILEIGTHIGASTLHICSALYFNESTIGTDAHLTTLDIRDVNSNFEKPWLEFGTEHSPKEMLEILGYVSFVTFLTDSSLNFLSKTEQKFDFIFLDGSHSASIVYQEIPAALRVLKNNGVILLHDYYPNNKPLWTDNRVISGPYKAVERLRNEGASIKALPLGNLPWKTKLDSNLTSLALLTRSSSDTLN